MKDLWILLESKDNAGAHHISPKPQNNQPNFVKCTHYKEKRWVLRAKAKFREIRIIIVDNFPLEFLQCRNTFKLVLGAAFKSNRQYKTRLVVEAVDRLLLTGKLYSTSELSYLSNYLQPVNYPSTTQNNVTVLYTYSSPCQTINLSLTTKTLHQMNNASCIAKLLTLIIYRPPQKICLVYLNTFQITFN